MARQCYPRGREAGRRSMPRQDLDDRTQRALEPSRGQPQARKQHRKAPWHMPETFGAEQMRDYASVQRSDHPKARMDYEGSRGQRWWPACAHNQNARQRDA